MTVPTFEPDAGSVRAARKFVATAVGDLPDLVAHHAALLVSELAANAVLHARTPFTVEVSESIGTLRISVRDSNVSLPVLKLYSPEASTGRGLKLVETMAHRWGVDPCPDGKVVWFELSFDGPSARG